MAHFRLVLSAWLKRRREEVAMSIVLGVLAALCGVCGLAALYFGYDLGGTERGVAYTVSGTIAASVGAVMIGLTVLSVRLKQLARLLGNAQGVSHPAESEPLPVPLSGSSLPPARDQRPSLPGSIAPGEIGIAAVAAAATALVPEEAKPSRAAPEKPEPAEKEAPTSPQPSAGLFEPRPLPEINLGLDDLLAPMMPKIVPDETAPEEARHHDIDMQETEDRQADDREFEAPEPEFPVDTPAEAETEAEPARLARGRDRLDSIFGPPPPEDELGEAAESEEQPAARALEDEPPADADDEPVVEDLPPWHGGAQFTPEPQEPAETGHEPEPKAATGGEPAAAPEQAGRKVIGSYTVGPNSYTMYADGSVEALTPNGLFSFGSLEELRSFIEKGGSPAASSR
jgi:hypothetical protein